MRVDRGGWVAPDFETEDFEPKPPHTSMSRLIQPTTSPAETDECRVDWSSVDFEPEDFDGEDNPLQRIRLQLPRGHGLAAIPFVLRSEDGGWGWVGWVGGSLASAWLVAFGCQRLLGRQLRTHLPRDAPGPTPTDASQP